MEGSNVRHGRDRPIIGRVAPRISNYSKTSKFEFRSSEVITNNVSSVLRPTILLTFSSVKHFLLLSLVILQTPPIGLIELQKVHLSSSVSDFAKSQHIHRVSYRFSALLF